MSNELVLVLALLAAAIAMFALGKPRMDAVALLMLTLLPFTGVITMAEALAGFADPNIVLIAALFVIGEGLELGDHHLSHRVGFRLLQRTGAGTHRRCGGDEGQGHQEGNAQENRGHENLPTLSLQPE